MLETILGDKKVVLGSKSANVVLESLGKIYLKFGNKTRVLNDLFDSIASTETDTTKKTIIVKTQSEFDELEYPGDGYFVYLASERILYFSYLNDYISLINLESSGYLTNPLKDTLEITTSRVPLKVVSSKLVENLNVEQLNGYRDYNFAKKAEDETIDGKWLFNGQNKATDTWTFDKHLAIGGSLISKNGFASGYSGHGWMLDASTNTLTIDNLIVRKILSVYELVVNKISATNGSLWISNAGKVSEVYFINTFLDDIISQQNVVTLQNNETTTKDFIDYTGVVITDEHLSPTPDFEFSSTLLYSTDFTKDVLETRKLILNQNNLREYLYLYYSYFNGFFYLIKLDEEGQNYPPFKVGDLLRCQKYSSGNIKYYDAIVVNASEDSKYYTIRLAGSVLDNYSDVIIDEEGNITAVDNSTNALSDSTINTNIVEVDIPYINTDGVLVTEENTGTLTLPTKDDGLVQMGSIINDNRKNAIYITSSDDRAPYIDILSGIDRPDYSVVIREIKTVGGVEVVETSDLLKCRLGNLSGIYEPSFKVKQPHGFGLYSNNVFLKGEFYLENGDTLVNFDENKIYLAYKNAGLEISDNSLGEPVLKLFGDQIEFWSGKFDSTDSTKLMSLTSLFNSDGSKINDSLINTDGILALLDVNGIIQSKGLIIRTANDELFNELVYNSTLCMKYNGLWVFDTDLNTYNTWNDLINTLDTTGNNTVGTFIKILDGTNVPSIGTTYKKGDVITTIHGRNTKVIVRLDVYTPDPHFYEITVKYDKLTNNSIKLESVHEYFDDIDPEGYKSGYHIFKNDDALPSGLVKNNISKYNDGVWTNYSSYTNSPEVLDLNYKVDSTVGCFISTGGKFYANGAEINGTINAISGTIGGFKIGDNHIGNVTSSSSGGGNLSIYNNFFRVGGNDGYVFFGNNVIPASAGGAFNATGRIVNQTINTGASWGYDACNTGLYISVTGGTKNFGIDSNAALKAPAFIGTKIKYLFFDSTYTIDFSQYSTFIIDATTTRSVTLPAESDIARYFSTSLLPPDFGFVCTFVHAPTGSDIILNGLTNWNNDIVNIRMSVGDSITLLVTKYPHFHYQILNLQQ